MTNHFPAAMVRTWVRVHSPIPTVVGWLVALGLATTLCADDTKEAENHFEEHIRPLLVKNCISCHGPAKHEGGLDLTTLAGMIRGGDSGPALVAGNADESLIVQALLHESFEMPPDKRLDDELISPVTQWINSGAYWPRGQVLRALSKVTDEDRQWWCLQPITDPPRPAVSNPDWCRNEIDYFVLARLDQAGLQPAPEATAAELYRRTAFDLSGLPPLYQSALDDLSVNEGWYATQIDQLLEQKAYGENQARYWLDLVRYADSDGYRADAVRPDAHLYRDYVIRSFNADKPYDQFIREQIAGDEIDPANRDAIVATMFLRHWIYEHNQRDVEGQWQEILDDVTETTSDAFLALGLKCAKCHDHKYDPLLQKDFFRLQAFFAAIHPREDVPVAGAEQQAEYLQQLRQWESATHEIRMALEDIERPQLLKHATREGFEKFVPEIKTMILTEPTRRSPFEQQIATLAERQYDLEPAKLPQWLDADTEARRQELRTQLASFDNLKPHPLQLQKFAIKDVGPVAPPTSIMGDPEKTPVLPGPPTIIDEEPAPIDVPALGLQSTGRRTALANWIASPTNPLTARVIVNRIWEQHFGVGLAENASDFGRLGAEPSHPQLLDWLASRFIEDGWSIKKLHRRILNSATYRQSSRHYDEAALVIDPANRWLWRMNPRRLSGEEIVDSMLFVSGELSQNGQRAIYEKVMRNNLHPVTSLFDFPDRIRSVSKRHRTTTSTQALLLMNNVWVEKRARKIQSQTSPLDSAGFVVECYQRLVCRTPSGDELNLALEFLQNFAQISPEPVAAELAAVEPTEDSTTTAKDPAANGEEPIVGASGKSQKPETANTDKAAPETAASEPKLSSNEQARLALIRMLLSSNEMVYID